MQKQWTLCLAGVAALALSGLAAVDLMAAADHDAPAPCASARGLWGLLEELVRTPQREREDRADRITGALRADRQSRTAPPAPSIAPIEIIAPPTVWEVPTFETPDAESPAASVPSDDTGLGHLLETYRTLSPSMKERLRGMRDADMVRTVERLARAERELGSALDSK